MKRGFLLLLTLLACSLASAAMAEAFYNPDGGSRLHADPFCPSVSMTYLPLASASGLDEAARAGYTPCNMCWTEEAAAAPAVPQAAETWYYNPDGGERRHLNRQCPSISAKYHDAMAELPQDSPLWAALQPCQVCGGKPSFCEMSLTDKAALLPGVWGVPGEEAIDADVATNRAWDALMSEAQLKPLERSAYRHTLLYYPAREAYCLVYLARVSGDGSALADWRLHGRVTVDAATGQVTGCQFQP